MSTTDPAEVRQLLTRREAAAILGCSSRTISRRIADGTLETGLRSNGQRGVMASSVMALRDAETLATEPERVAQSSATPVATETVQVAMAYATLAQAVRGYLDAGWLARRGSRDQLRAALEETMRTVAPVDALSAPSEAPALPAGDTVLEDAQTP